MLQTYLYLMNVGESRRAGATLTKGRRDFRNPFSKSPVPLIRRVFIFLFRQKDKLPYVFLCNPSSGDTDFTPKLWHQFQIVDPVHISTKRSSSDANRNSMVQLEGRVETLLDILVTSWYCLLWSLGSDHRGAGWSPSESHILTCRQCK